MASSNPKSLFFALLLFLSSFSLTAFAAAIPRDADLALRDDGHVSACKPRARTGHPVDSGATQLNAPEQSVSEQPVPEQSVPDLPVYPQPPSELFTSTDKHVKVRSTQYQGIMKTYNTEGQEQRVLRDLGYTGVLNDKIIWSFGDTSMGTLEKNMICAVDSVSLGDMQDPMRVTQTAMAPNNDHFANWIDTDAQENADHGLSIYAFGGTNIIQTAPNQGLVYYYKIRRPGGHVQRIGAGIATVTMDGDVPKSNRVGSHIWDADEPSWGDVGVAYDKRDDYVYAFGHGVGGLGVYTFLTRAPAAHATSVESYEYWNNATQTWSPTRLSSSGGAGFDKLTKDHAIFDWMEMDQAAPFWSNYFNKWMFIYTNSFGSSDLLAMTADKLEGPWQDHGSVASTDVHPSDADQVDGMRYAGMGHPEFDASGKTVLATWTRRNQIYGTTIEWE